MVVFNIGTLIILPALLGLTLLAPQGLIITLLSFICLSGLLMSLALGERQRAIVEARFSLSRELAASNAEIAAKAEFLAKISHEIRTPMNAIVGFAEILESDHDDDEKVNYYTSVIKLRSFDLLDIVNELLDIASIESGQLECVESAVNLDQLFNRLNKPSLNTPNVWVRLILP